MVSVSGIRGVVGASLTVPVLVDYAAAFGHFLPPGPIVIGQACEFDYSGTQACKALREEGLRVVLINSNPATIMTDPELADATYVEPLTVEVLDRVLAHEKVSAILRAADTGYTAPLCDLANDLRQKDCTLQQCLQQRECGLASLPWELCIPGVPDTSTN